MTDLILMVALLMLGHYRMRAACVASSVATPHVPPPVPILWRLPARGLRPAPRTGPGWRRIIGWCR